jgi:hypothetical protein
MSYTITQWLEMLFKLLRIQPKANLKRESEKQMAEAHEK